MTAMTGTGNKHREKNKIKNKQLVVNYKQYNLDH